MKAISLATLCLGAVISTQQVQAASSGAGSYPFMVYSGMGNDSPQEVTTPVTFDQVLNKYKEFVGDATNVVVIVKEGLTSEDLAQNAKQFKFLGSKLVLNSFSYSNVEGGFDLSAYESAIHAHQKYSLESLADIDALSSKVSADLKSTNALFKISLISVSADIPNSQVDKIIEKIEKIAESVDQKAVFVVAGSSAPSMPHLINFAEIDSNTVPDGTVVTLNTVGDDPYFNGPIKYLYPNCLIALLFAGFILSILIIGFLLLMSVQTPYNYPEQSIDFGKIEK